MKRTIQYIQYLSFILLVFSCEDREPDVIIIPEWLKPRLEELENSGDCNGCTVQRWTYNEEFFYHVYCTDWSCIDCEIYHYDSTPVVWDETLNQADYEQNKDRPEIIWQCGDEL